MSSEPDLSHFAVEYANASEYIASETCQEDFRYRFDDRQEQGEEGRHVGVRVIVLEDHHGVRL